MPVVAPFSVAQLTPLPPAELPFKQLASAFNLS